MLFHDLKRDYTMYVFVNSNGECRHFTGEALARMAEHVTIETDSEGTFFHRVGPYGRITEGGGMDFEGF